MGEFDFEHGVKKMDFGDAMDILIGSILSGFLTGFVTKNTGLGVIVGVVVCCVWSVLILSHHMAMS